jgi:hypothetical protein
MHGYGVTSFVLSLIKPRQTTGPDLRGGNLALRISREMLTAEVELFDGAKEAVARWAPCIL